MKKFAIIGIIIAVSLAAFFVFSSDNEVEAKEDVTLYKSPTCGCCAGWGQHMSRDYNVDTIMQENLDPLKDQYKIPQHLRSCHTSIVGDYFVEGHIPQEAVDKLLEEQPDIDGIAMPGMPSGSPGMPGRKSETWIIYTIKDGKASEFMRI